MNSQENEFHQGEKINDNKPVKKRKWLKRLVYFFGWVVLLAFLFFLTIYLWHTFKGADDLSPNDDDLLLYKVVVPEHENSYFDLLKFSKVLDEEEVVDSLIEINIPDEIDVMNYLDSDDWDQEMVENLLEDNKEVLDVYSVAASKPVFQYDLTADPANIDHELPIVGLSDWKQAARLSSIKAIYLMKQGDQELALAEAMKSVIIGHQIEKSENLLLITYFVGMEMKKIGLEALQFLMSQDALSSEVLEKYQNELRNYYSISNDSFFKAEYLVVKKGIINNFYLSQENNETPLKNNYYYKPNQTLGLFADSYRLHIKRLNTPCDENLPEVEIWKPSLIKYFNENLLGKVLVNVGSSAVSFANIRDRRCDIDALIDEIVYLLP
jgi:hypothetical protein